MRFIEFLFNFLSYLSLYNEFINHKSLQHKMEQLLKLPKN
jgi:hypothetical protein